ncbi:LysR family transcriptional regulator [Aquabacterium sp. A08]|uniref:LysR family transcriptional regulator n=1 Tax=Aquabacterium sp. A08 TaxID=2718532 RepID=UPI00141F21C2|nr:LysR family transcriptional regulator [Aquabacterium sp. A08]NIC42951.1 LysR family transcriptional regulator [Aquabacterium sp. A08]
MSVTFRQLRTLLALAEHGSVSGAARATHVTQPTASMQLRELTESVGLPLHEVIGKKVHLTAAGEALVQTARGMVDAWALFEQQVAAMKGLHRGRLKVAVVSTAKYFVPRWLGSFCQAHPEVEIALEILNRDGVVQRLRQNRDDLCIMSIPPRDLEVDAREFLANPLVVVAPRGHALAGRAALTLADIQGERFILRETGSGTRMAAAQHFAAQGWAPQVRLELGSNEAIKQAVAGGLGIAVLSRHALAADPAQEGLALLPVQGFPIHAHWYIVRLRGKQLSPIARAFEHHLLRQALGRGPGPEDG